MAREKEGSGASQTVLNHRECVCGGGQSGGRDWSKCRNRGGGKDSWKTVSGTNVDNLVSLLNDRFQRGCCFTFPYKNLSIIYYLTSFAVRRDEGYLYALELPEAFLELYPF